MFISAQEELLFNIPTLKTNVWQQLLHVAFLLFLLSFIWAFQQHTALLKKKKASALFYSPRLPRCRHQGGFQFLMQRAAREDTPTRGRRVAEMSSFKHFAQYIFSAFSQELKKKQDKGNWYKKPFCEASNIFIICFLCCFFCTSSLIQPQWEQSGITSIRHVGDA